MPVSASAILLSLFLLLIMALVGGGFVASWGWALWRLRNGQALIPTLVEPPRVPWGLGSVVLIVLTWFVVNLTVVLAYTQMTQGIAITVAKAGKAAGPADAPTLGFTEQMAIVSVINLALLLAIPAVLYVTSRARLSDLGLFRRHLPQQILVGTVAFFLMSPIVYAINGLAVLIWKPESHPLEKMVRNELSMGIAQLAILSAVILAPVTEELIFRGVIQRWLVRIFNPLGCDEATIAEPDSLLDPDHPQEKAPQLEATQKPLGDLAASRDENPYSAPSSPIIDLAPPPNSATRPDPVRDSIQPILLTSFLFAAVHFPQWPAPLGIFVLSLGLGFVAQRSGSLIAAMVMHALFNGLGTLLLLVMVQLGSLGLTDKKEKGNPPPSCVVPEQTISRFSTHRQVGTAPRLWDQ